jgi:hypothetical protein
LKEKSLAVPILEMRSQFDAVQDHALSAMSLIEITPGLEAPQPQSFAVTPPIRLAVPRRGHVLSTVAEYYGSSVREAVAALSASVARAPQADTASAVHALRNSPYVSEVYRPDSEIVARLIVSVWVAGIAIKAIPVSGSLSQAGSWFFGGEGADPLTALASGKAIAKAESALRAQADPTAYLELLPYILDPHGPGSRLSVRRDPSTRLARTLKREDGIFYTPADVADYMAGACIDAVDGDIPTVLDPACGTGVFLRATLGALRQRYPKQNAASLASECLFGADIDPWALDATAFVLLADTWTGPGITSRSPVTIWQRLRRNLACIDTLRVDPVQTKRSFADGRIPISRLFPGLERAPTIVLGNPPYADLGARSDLAELGSIFHTIAAKPRPGAEVYLAFIEQMIRLADAKRCAGALVLPLSIACNVGSQFMTARKLIAGTQGIWRFAFFDREPHALFGEDVKTRNAILLWSRTSRDVGATIATGPLRKWRGDSRAAMFKSLQFTPIEADVRSGIPKIEGPSQAAALKALSGRSDRLERATQGICRRTLATSSHADDRTVFVGPTAYNFLNVFLRPPRALLRNEVALSEHPLHAIACASRQDALAIFALLSSHLAYWWWHAQGDGFHVSGRFLSEFPFGIDALSGTSGEALSRCGEELWLTISSRPIISLNRGRTSLAFTPNGHDQIRREIDQILAGLARLQPAFVDELQQFTAHTVAATLRVHTNSGTGGGV